MLYQWKKETRTNLQTNCTISGQPFSRTYSGKSLGIL